MIILTVLHKQGPLGDTGLPGPKVRTYNRREFELSHQTEIDPCGLCLAYRPDLYMKASFGKKFATFSSRNFGRANQDIFHELPHELSLATFLLSQSRAIVGTKVREV